MDTRLNLYKLSLFKKVAETGSFTRTAEHFLLHQSSVSLHIADLEKSLGVKLFNRQGRQATLTDAGELLFPHAEEMLASSQAAIEALEAYKGVWQGQLSIGASTTPGAWLLPKWLGTFQEKYPHIAIDLEIGNSQQVLDWLQNGRVAVAIVGQQPDEQLFQATPLINDEIVLVVGQTHPWVARANITLAEVQAARMVCREAGSAIRQITEARLGEMCCQIRPSLELGSTTAIKQAVIANLGIAFLPKIAVQAEITLGQLKIVPVNELVIERTIYFVQMKKHWQSPAALALKAMLTESLRNSTA